MNKKIESFYSVLYRHFGPQNWWPAETPFEVMVGAILTQNTSWNNVEKAIGNIRKKKLLSARKLAGLSESSLAGLIRPAGYYNVKSRRLKHFIKYLLDNYRADIKKMRKDSLGELRRQLLSVNGIGPETADSILLYALNKPVFVIDAYTKRIFNRHGLLDKEAGYGKAQELFMANLKPDVKMYNEYHALLVKLAKEFCLKNKPKCAKCPLNPDFAIAKSALRAATPRLGGAGGVNPAIGGLRKNLHVRFPYK